MKIINRIQHPACQRLFLFCALSALPAVAQMKPTEPILPLKAGEIKQQAPPKEPVLALNVPLGFPNYQLIYSANPSSEKATQSAFRQRFIAIRDVKSAGLSNGDVKTRFFDVGAPFWLYDFKFSPDGQYTTLKVGVPFGGNYGFFLWNLQTQTVTAGPKVPLRFPRLSWSPNSKYIAYVQGGDEAGSTWNSSQTVGLYVFDVDKGTSTLVAQSKSAADLNWTNNNTLIYSTQKEVTASSESAGDLRSPSRLASSIFEFDVTKNESQLVLKGGSQPLPSPGGKWILFRADKDFIEALQKAEPKKQDAQMRKGAFVSPWYLMNVDNKHYYNVPLNVRSYSDLIWTPDDEDIVELVRLEDGKTAKLNIVNATSQQKSSLTSVTAQRNSRNDAFVEISLFSISKSGKFILVATTESGDIQPEGGLLDGYGFLLAVERDTGKIYRLVDSKNVTGFDFREIDK